jgi:hypothetical protein
MYYIINLDKLSVKLNLALRERYVISKSNAQFGFRSFKMFVNPESNYAINSILRHLIFIIMIWQYSTALFAFNVLKQL